jgi:predicted dehydrogenase
MSGCTHGRKLTCVGRADLQAWSPMRLAVIGAGAGVFTMHRPALGSSHLDVVGLSDVVDEPARSRARDLGCPFFENHRVMLSATTPDVVTILAPHPFHAPLALDAMRAGAHVLVEKPIAVQVSEADAMIEMAARVGRLLAVNLQQRARAEVRTARGLIQSGRLGQIQRVAMTATWTRTAAYYALAGWRGTWLGEGGGVLMNQAPHTLDVLCHLLGQPSRVVAWNRTLVHAIETEDTSLAMLEWPNGAHGTLLVSTAQAGEPERLEIVGTRGGLLVQRGQVSFSEAEADLVEFMRTSDNPFGTLAYEPRPVDLEPGTGDHRAIYDNLVRAIADGEPLIADGAQGRLSLELANALIYSSHIGQAVDLPLDRAAYADMLAHKQNQLVPSG